MGNRLFAAAGDNRRQHRKANLTNTDVRRPAKILDRSRFGIQSAVSLSEGPPPGTPDFLDPQTFRAAASCRLDVISHERGVNCATCLGTKSALCAKLHEKLENDEHLSGRAVLESSVQIVPPRRSIYHPKEWSEYIPIICHGWAASSITLPDGRRQILSFVLPGDLVSTAGFLEPMSGRTVEAITEVTYRKFKRSELRTFMFAHSDLMDILSKTLVEDRMEVDQLALDLGRRPADERIGRLILKLAKKLAARGMMNDRTMEFPLRQRHIADATGLTPVHVSKMMGEFQRNGLIEISGRSLTIIDETELYRIADWR